MSKINEVAPPGWGHTKAEKEKTKPNKPKSKIGGSAAAFKRALDDGRFKGLPGDKTKKEKTASMFKLMWSMKKKGDKPHYKPGTDKKYKKYQDVDEAVKGQDTERRKAASADRRSGERISKKEAPSKTKNYVTQQQRSIKYHDKVSKGKFIPGMTTEDLGFTIDSGEHKKASKKAKMRNLAKGNTNPNEKAAAEKKAGGPKLIGELNRKEFKKLNKAGVGRMSDNPKEQDKARLAQAEVDLRDLMRQRKSGKVGVGKSMRTEELTFEGWKDAARSAIKRVSSKKSAPKHDYGKDAGAEAAKRLRKKDHEKVNFLDPDD